MFIWKQNKKTKDFSEDRHGTFKESEDNSLVKLICGNVVTHTSDTAKTEININWTAPKRGSGCVTFRATVIEHRDVWYMDDGPLSKDFCEDEDTQDDYLSIIVESCRACSEAKYEVEASLHLWQIIIGYRDDFISIVLFFCCSF